jgi:hypothetical protein
MGYPRPSYSPVVASLDAEQEALLALIVEMYRSVPRDQRDGFLILDADQATSILMPGAPDQPSVVAADVRALVEAGYLRLVAVNDRYSRQYDVTQSGFEHYESAKRRSGEPTQALENAVTSYLDSTSFAGRHAASYAKWRQAADELWSTDSERELTSVGHHVREAMQIFATECVDEYGASDAPPQFEQHINRIWAVIDLARPKMGDAETAFLEALARYWEAANKLAQRQEHGMTRAASLTWEDARRLIFATAFVMYELDRAFVRSLAD